MSAIRPNLNFYNERQEHTPYQDRLAEKAREVYQRLQQDTGKASKKPLARVDPEAAAKWFKRND
jgi:hypothetical protein